MCSRPRIPAAPETPAPVAPAAPQPVAQKVESPIDPSKKPGNKPGSVRRFDLKLPPTFLIPR